MKSETNTMRMKNVRQHCARMLVLMLVAVVTGCSGGGAGTAQKGHVPQEADTRYTEAAAINIHRADPERALVIIDSAVIVGNVTWERGEYLKAVTQYGQGNYALSRQMCLDLIDCVQTRWSNPRNIETLEHVYSLLVSIENYSGQFPAVIRYATEASRLAHAMDRPELIGNMEANIAYALARTGRTEEGIDHLRTVVADLRQIDTYNGINAFYTASKKLLHLLSDNHRYAEMVPVCEDMLQRIDEFAHHPDSFNRVPEGFDPSEFADMAQGQALAFLTIAYAGQYMASVESSKQSNPAMRAELLRKALDTESRLFKTKWGNTSNCDRLMIGTYHLLGQFDRFDAAMARLDAAMTDTVNVNYSVGLGLRAQAARMRGRMAEAVDYLQRKAVIDDSIASRNMREKLTELATVYHLQEAQLSRQKAEDDARLYSTVAIVVSIALLIAIALTVYSLVQKQRIKEKNRVLVRLINEQQINNKKKPTDNKQEPTGDKQEPSNDKSGPSRELFDRIDATIRGERLFADVNLQRQNIIDHFGIGRHTLNQLLNEFTNEQSFIAYINNIRLDEALLLLNTESERNIGDIAASVGFTPSNLRQQFKKRFGITPTEYRQA